MLNENSMAVINELENDFRKLARLPEDGRIDYKMVSPNGKTAHKKVYGKIYRKAYLTRGFTPEENITYWDEPEKRRGLQATGKISTLKEQIYLQKPFPLPNVNLQVRGEMPVIGQNSVSNVREELENMKSLFTRFNNRISQNLLPLANFKDMIIFENSWKKYNINFDRRTGTWRTPIEGGTLVVKENSTFRKQGQDYDTDYMEIICKPKDDEAVKNYHTRCKIRDKHGAENSENLTVLMEGFLEDLDKLVSRI